MFLGARLPRPPQDTWHSLPENPAAHVQFPPAVASHVPVALRHGAHASAQSSPAYPVPLRSFSVRKQTHVPATLADAIAACLAASDANVASELIANKAAPTPASNPAGATHSPRPKTHSGHGSEQSRPAYAGTARFVDASILSSHTHTPRSTSAKLVSFDTAHVPNPNPAGAHGHGIVQLGPM